jgi:hypothetical protein
MYINIYKPILNIDSYVFSPAAIWILVHAMPLVVEFKFGAFHIVARSERAQYARTEGDVGEVKGS